MPPDPSRLRGEKTPVYAISQSSDESVTRDVSTAGIDFHSRKKKNPDNGGQWWPSVKVVEQMSRRSERGRRVDEGTAWTQGENAFIKA
ncbi:hypothetical protein EYF80_060060 [Liparis tanakae]|uniref:Uncharacterized protein n=1 Tax=Liparis tanakae TaxID=230148 RepID=A0A4Z2EMK0_9TELE|nr:hypothetical protein EYF80_060060 [Liparis tanakae]